VRGEGEDAAGGLAAVRQMGTPGVALLPESMPALCSRDSRQEVDRCPCVPAWFRVASLPVGWLVVDRLLTV